MARRDLPDPKAIPGFTGIMKTLPEDVTILGMEPELTFEWKLAIYDAKIANNIETGNLEAVGRLVEFREAIIEERFVLTADYKAKKKKLLDDLEHQEAQLLREENPIGANRIRFQKFRGIFRAQEQFLARNYPFKVHIKEKLGKWAGKTAA